MKLKGSIAVVTGSSSGIGKETAIALSKKGAKVAVTYNTNREGGEETLEECLKHSEAMLLHLDVRDDDSINKTKDAVLDKFGCLDLLVNNAGVIRWKELLEQSFEDVEEQASVNFTGLVKVTRAFLPHLIERDEAVIINIASVAGKEGYSELSTYCGTKFGVRGFTQALAAELPGNVRIYSVNPTSTATQMTGFQGMAPSKAAKVVVKAAEEKTGAASGGDVDVLDHVQ